MYKNFILKDKLHIYNNRAKSGKSVGRLSVEYNVYPAPAIFWDFEVENKGIDLPEHDVDGKLITPFECNSFSILNPLSEKVHLSGGNRMTGSAIRAISGDATLRGKSFAFFLPNAKFQEVGLSGKNFVTKEVAYKKYQVPLRFSESFREGFVDASIGKDVTLNLLTPIESLTRLKDHRSIGTYITTWGELSVKEELSVIDATDLLYDIALLLSFANGGFIAPVVVTMQRSDFEQEYPTVFSAFLVDSVEHIGNTWLNKQSDLADLLKCFPSFQKMLHSDEWKANYSVVLMWYFQAIQRYGIQLGGKPWPVVANALGAALEKLASIILVEEKKVVADIDFYGDGKKKRGMILETKIRKLLETIGITTPGPKYRGHDAVWWFVKMRNDATHPKSIYDWTGEEINLILSDAIQWVEEVLLWRLGYEGGYGRHSGSKGFHTSPRYQIDLRDASW